LGRTRQTFAEISPYHSNTPVFFEKKIREKCGGILEGRLISEAKHIAEVNFYLIVEKRNSSEKIQTNQW
jgi:broad specificity phosphatase PhoE